MRKKSRITATWTLSSLALSISMQGMAATIDAVNVQLEPLIITATRTGSDWLDTPASVYSLQFGQTTDNINVNLSEKLQGVAGLQVNNRENYAQDLQISSRGFGARSTFGIRGIRFYVDGIPATMPDGQGQISHLELSTLDNIEVLTGPFSALYGNSSGGTILATTREGHGDDSIDMSYAVGDHGRQNASLSLQGGSSSPAQPAYMVSTSRFHTDGFREHSGADKLLNNAKLSWTLRDNSKLNWMVNTLDIEADDPGGISRQQWASSPYQQASYLKPFDMRKNIQQIQTGLTYNKSLDDGTDLYAMTYLGHRDVKQFQSIAYSTQLNSKHAGGVIDFSRDYYGADLRLTKTDLLPHTVWVMGVAVDAMQEKRQGFENYILNGTTPIYGVQGALRRNEDNTLWNADPYLQLAWEFLPAWRLETGLRYSNIHYQTKDHYIVSGNGDDSGQRDYQQMLPSAGLNWRVNDTVSLYASYAHGFETPTFTELAYSYQDGINSSLRASHSENYELGLKSDSSYGMFSLAGFWIKTEDDIVSAGSSNGRSIYRNADETTRQGIELSWKKHLTDNLLTQLSYSYVDAIFSKPVPDIRDSITHKLLKSGIPWGNKIPGIAARQLYSSLRWGKEDGLNLLLDMQYKDKIFVNDENSEYAPSAAVFGAEAGYTWHFSGWKMHGFVRANNLLDKRYIGSVIVNDSNSRYYEPADGFNLLAGLSLQHIF